MNMSGVCAAEGGRKEEGAARGLHVRRRCALGCLLLGLVPPEERDLLLLKVSVFGREVSRAKSRRGGGEVSAAMRRRSRRG